MSKPIYCQHCGNEIKSKYAKKFCNRSCAAKFNNKGVVRNGKNVQLAFKFVFPPKPKRIKRPRPSRPLVNCYHCKNETKNAKYCSAKCVGLSKTKYFTAEEQLEAYRLKNRIANAKYNAKKRNQIPHDADMEKIKEIYLNCPEGYEVDHIIPISKHGTHHQDNLQYLTIQENRSKGNRLDWKK